MKFKTNIEPHELPYIKEDKIHREIFGLESKRSSVYQKKAHDFLSDIKEIEREICYLQREVDIRQRRKAAHIKFDQKRSRYRENRANRR